MGVRVIWSCPTYGHVDPEHNSSAMVAQMVATNRTDIVWAGVASPDRTDHRTARNKVLEVTKGSEFDFILFADSDMKIPPQGIEHLIKADKKFISGLFFNRRPPFHPTIGYFNDHHQVHMIWSWPDDTIFPVDATGFAFTLVHRDVIEAVGDNPFDKVYGLSEDLAFCWRAKEAGIQMYCHTGVQVTHLGMKQEITPDQWRESREQIDKVSKEFMNDLS